MDATATRMTAERYHAVSVEGDRTQLIDGAIVVNEPKPIHSLLQVRLVTALHRWVEAGADRGLAITPTSLTIDEHNVYAPDVLWFSEERRPADLHEYPDRVPDLCVEIRSPGAWRYDVGAKKAVYERAGLPELWLVDDAAEAVLVYRRSTSDSPAFDVALELPRGETLTSPQLPCFSLGLHQLFQD